MKRVIAVFEFDDKKLGAQWMNEDNLQALLYGDAQTKRDIYKLVSYTDMQFDEPEKRLALHAKLTEIVCAYCPTNAPGCIGLKCTVSNADLDVIVDKVFTHLDSNNDKVDDNPESEG